MAMEPRPKTWGVMTYSDAQFQGAQPRVPWLHVSGLLERQHIMVSMACSGEGWVFTADRKEWARTKRTRDKVSVGTLPPRDLLLPSRHPLLVFSPIRYFSLLCIMLSYHYPSSKKSIHLVSQRTSNLVSAKDLTETPGGVFSDPLSISNQIMLT